MAREVVGMDNIIRNLNKEIKKIEGRTEAGMLQAALFIKGESQKEIPVVTGHARASAFVVSSSGINVEAGADEDTIEAAAEAKAVVSAKTKAGNPSSAVGFGAVYAAALHENPRAGQTGGVSPSGVPYRAPINPSGERSSQGVYSTVGKWKFLEDPIKTNVRRILQIIARKAKIR